MDKFSQNSNLKVYVRTYFCKWVIITTELTNSRTKLLKNIQEIKLKPFLFARSSFFIWLVTCDLGAKAIAISHSTLNWGLEVFWAHQPSPGQNWKFVNHAEKLVLLQGTRLISNTQLKIEFLPAFSSDRKVSEIISAKHTFTKL